MKCEWITNNLLRLNGFLCYCEMYTFGRISDGLLHYIDVGGYSISTWYILGKVINIFRGETHHNESNLKPHPWNRNDATVCIWCFKTCCLKCDHITTRTPIIMGTMET